jgi:hypothetical protein
MLRHSKIKAIEQNGRQEIQRMRDEQNAKVDNDEMTVVAQHISEMERHIRNEYREYNMSWSDKQI